MRNQSNQKISDVAIDKPKEARKNPNDRTGTCPLCGHKSLVERYRAQNTRGYFDVEKHSCLNRALKSQNEYVCGKVVRNLKNIETGVMSQEVADIKARKKAVTKREIVAALVKQGKTDAQIASDLNMPRSCVLKHRKKAGLPMNKVAKIHEGFSSALITASELKQVMDEPDPEAIRLMALAGPSLKLPEFEGPPEADSEESLAFWNEMKIGFKWFKCGVVTALDMMEKQLFPKTMEAKDEK